MPNYIVHSMINFKNLTLNKTFTFEEIMLPIKLIDISLQLVPKIKRLCPMQLGTSASISMLKIHVL